MPFVPFPDTAEVEIRYLQDGQQTENTLYFHKATTWDATDLAGLASNIRDWWDGAIAPFIHNSVQLREIVATDISSESGSQFVLSGGGLAGTAGGTVTPNNVAFCVSFRTGLRGRSFRGRNYMPGVTFENLADANHMLGVVVDNILIAYSGLLTAVLPEGQAWVVASRFAGGLPRTVGMVTPVVSVVATDTTLDSMRTRLPGRGA